MIYTASTFAVLVGFVGYIAGYVSFGNGGGALFGIIGAIAGFIGGVALVDFISFDLEEWMKRGVISVCLFLIAAMILYRIGGYVWGSWGVY